MTEGDAIEYFRLALVNLTGLEDSEEKALVILADGDNPRPSEDHLWVRNRTEVSESRPKYVDGVLHQVKVLTLVVEAIGETACGLLKYAKSCLQTIGHPEPVALTNLGISIRTVSDVQNVSAILYSSSEPRISINFSIGYKWTAEAETPGEFSEIVVDTTDGDTLSYTETFVIP